MKEAPHQRLLRLQKRIFQTLRNESIQLLGETPKSIWRYEAEFKSDFRRRSQLTSVSKDDLIEAIRQVPVTFIGDFHTFGQAQKTALRLIRDGFNSGERGLIGLEMVQSRFQSELDQFQSGRLSLADFLRAIRYSDEWGFPWKNYAPIFDWARENHFQLIALNQPKEFRWSAENDEKELQARDRWAAGVITDRLGRNGKIDRSLRMIVLYGEMHVAHSHLPRQLETISKGVYREPIRSLTIHQNYDPLFWQLSREQDSIQSQIFKLNRRTYCVFSGTPWTKLQSVIAWVEGAEDEPYDELNPDLLSWVKTSGTVIGEFLRCPVPSFESLNIRTIQEIDFIEDLREDSRLSRGDLRLIRCHVMNSHPLYVPALSLAFLPSPSHNDAAEIAAVHFLNQRTRNQTLFDPRNPDDFFRLVLESGFGFLGSLILNPRRKCDLLTDHSRRIQELQGKRQSRRGRTGKSPRKLSTRIRQTFRDELSARTLTEFLLRHQKSAIRAGTHAHLKEWMRAIQDRKRAASNMVAAKYIGYVLGLHTHQALISGALNVEDVPRFFFATRGFEGKYLELLPIVTQPDFYRSKQEML